MQNDAAHIAYGDYTAEGTTATNTQEQQTGTDVTFTSRYSDQLYQSGRYLMQQHQDMVNRHALCLTRLREAAMEADSIRLENATLRSVNRELNKQLSVLIRNSVQSHFGYNMAPLQMLNEFHGLAISGGGGEGEDQDQAAGWDDVCGESPTSVMERVDVERSSLPKSISVRSNGYLKTSQGGGAGQGGKTRSTGSASRPGTSGSVSASQKVYLRGAKKEEEPIELEVYNQGMFKTELCNKWQETGACPYADHCQFAHGIEELRPVIRHPRYKTEVCRMVLAGDVCPYGHRCHFRHALTEQEKLMGYLKPKSSKP